MKREYPVIEMDCSCYKLLKTSQTRSGEQDAEKEQAYSRSIYIINNPRRFEQEDKMPRKNRRTFEVYIINNSRRFEQEDKLSRKNRRTSGVYLN
jgi:hypothetical protein